MDIDRRLVRDARSDATGMNTLDRRDCTSRPRSLRKHTSVSTPFQTVDVASVKGFRRYRTYPIVVGPVAMGRLERRLLFLRRKPSEWAACKHRPQLTNLSPLTWSSLSVS